MKSRNQIKREISKLHKEMQCVIREVAFTKEAFDIADEKFQNLDRRIMLAYREKSDIEIRLRNQSNSIEQ